MLTVPSGPRLGHMQLVGMSAIQYKQVSPDILGSSTLLWSPAVLQIALQQHFVSVAQWMAGHVPGVYGSLHPFLQALNAPCLLSRKQGSYVCSV